MSFRMPAEHGAWGMLLVPFFSAAAVAGVPTIQGSLAPVVLAGVCLLGLFLLRGSVDARWGSRAWREPAHVVLAGVAGAAAGALLFSSQRYQFVWLGLAAAALYLLQSRLAGLAGLHNEKRSLAAELVGVVLLSLAAPVAWISARGRLDATGIKVWLLNLLFFLGGVLYVKYRVRGVLAHRTFSGLGERLAFAWPVVLYHFLLLAFLACWTVLDSISAAVVLAFLPGALRANSLLLQLGRRFHIRRLGWSEIAHSVLFAALLILAFRQIS